MLSCLNSYESIGSAKSWLSSAASSRPVASKSCRIGSKCNCKSWILSSSRFAQTEKVRRCPAFAETANQSTSSTLPMMPQSAHGSESVCAPLTVSSALSSASSTTGSLTTTTSPTELTPCDVPTRTSRGPSGASGSALIRALTTLDGGRAGRFGLRRGRDASRAGTSTPRISPLSPFPSHSTVDAPAKLPPPPPGAPPANVTSIACPRCTAGGSIRLTIGYDVCARLTSGDSPSTTAAKTT